MELHATEKVNLESLLTKEELEQLKDIRVKTIPKKIHQIGEGTYGKVFLFQFEDGYFRVGKKSKINLYKKSAEEESGMKKETRFLHQLCHERIIEFYGFYLDHSQIVIFMEAMNGSVKDELNKKGSLSEMEAMNYFIQAAEGLVYLHSRKPKAIIHRDIKCENLLLTTEKNLKLADFGLAVDLAISSGSVSLTSNAPTMFAGTQYFMAPEVIRKMDKPEAYGRKSDIWSLACTLVQMISGKPPYSQLGFIEIIQRSSGGSKNPLKYSGNLLPRASNIMKKLLDSMFVANCSLRPNAKMVLTLAYGVAKTFQNDREIGNKLKDNDRRQTISNGLQTIEMKNQQTLIKAESAEMVHNVKNFVNQQQIISNEFEHGKKWRGISKVEEDFVSCREFEEQGHTQVQNNLGVNYDNKQDASLFDEEVFKWCKVSAHHGNSLTQRNLRNIYENIRQPDEESAKWCRQAAEQGAESAQFLIGFRYEKGNGVPQSDEEAVKWYRKSAEQGHERAQVNLGVMYENGRGVSKSDEEAAKWYRKSAEQGNLDAQCKIGFMYANGKGVPQLDEEAVKWYAKAAERGYTCAQHYLRELSKKGRAIHN